MARPSDGSSAGPDLIWPFPTKNLGAAPGQVALGGPVAAGDKYKGQVARVDQGWDLQDYANWDNPGDVYAVASGTVHIYGDPNKPNVAFGPSYPVITLDIDPATWKTPPPQPYSKAIYYGHTIATVKDGAYVVQGDKIATLGQGPQGDANSPSQAIPLYGWLEIGWDNGSGDPIGPLSNTSPATAAGASMKAVLEGAPTATGQGGGGGGTGTGNGDGGNNNNKGGNNPSTDPTTVTIPPADWYSDKYGATDPRDNLPFSAFFLGQRIVGATNVSSSPTAGRAGSLTVQFQGAKTPSMPGVTLVRGGMAQLTPPNTPNARKDPFRCFFMMNPSSVASSATIDTTGVASPFTQTQALQAAATYPMQNQSYTFTIMFNRMYEVWQGNVGNPHPDKGGKDGPSQLGVRWDIRALERLMGQFDAVDNPGSPGSGTIGEGSFGPGDYPPQSLPLQIIFGGSKSIQFQGVIVQMDVTYTMFSADMIPTEASVDIGVMRLYLPQMAGANLLNILDRGNFHQIGKPVTGLNPNATFNTYLGGDLTRSQAPNFMGPLPGP